MNILTIRTDKLDSEIGFFQDATQIGYDAWPAHRHLAETIHTRIKDLLRENDTTIQQIDALVIYRGPGSFTGLRIGISLANSLASSLSVPIVGESGDCWIETGIKQLLNQYNDRQVTPLYGGDPHITQPRK